MLQDQMGGDDYGDYGEEAEGFKREGEVENDFMWTKGTEHITMFIWPYFLVYNEKRRVFHKMIIDD